MLEYALRPAIMQDLYTHLHGELICSNDRRYDANRKVWNGIINTYPASIVHCADMLDVVTTVQFARDHHLVVAVRSGGHSINGNSVCNGGMVIDLSCMKDICINPERQTAWAQAGLTLREFVQATQAYGLSTTTGTVGGTGLAGLTIGGGLGWLMGKYGLTIDNLLSVDLVTASGPHRAACRRLPSISATVESLRKANALLSLCERLANRLSICFVRSHV
jgi:FAD/FMN-containing dehydrogenase